MVAPMNFPLNLPLAKSGLDRAAHMRSDKGQLESLWAKAKIAHFNGEKFLSDEKGLIFLSPEELAGGERYFLGIDDAGTPYFLFHSEVHLAPEENYHLLREANLNDLQIGIAVHGQSLALWHKRHPKCSMCGADTQSSLGGAVRKCQSCDIEHYPRTDPAIIVLTRDRHDRILLGRQEVWPEHRFSTFAGFVEPGEAFEAAVVREVKEEVGLDIALFDTRLETIPTTETFRDLIPPVFMNRHDINVTHEHIAMVYFARSTTKEVINQESEHSDDIRWVSKADLASLDLSPQVSVYAKRALEVLGSQS